MIGGLDPESQYVVSTNKLKRTDLYEKDDFLDTNDYDFRICQFWSSFISIVGYSNYSKYYNKTSSEISKPKIVVS